MGFSALLGRMFGDCSSCSTSIICVNSAAVKPLGPCLHSPVLPTTLYNEFDGRAAQSVWWFP